MLWGCCKLPEESFSNGFLALWSLQINSAFRCSCLLKFKSNWFSKLKIIRIWLCFRCWLLSCQTVAVLGWGEMSVELHQFLDNSGGSNFTESAPRPPVGPGEENELHSTGGHSDRKSTRLNSSHLVISYAVFCLKKKKISNYSSLSLSFLSPYPVL